MERFSLTTGATLTRGVDQARDHVFDEVVVLKELDVVRLQCVDCLREASRNVAFQYILSQLIGLILNFHFLLPKNAQEVLDNLDVKEGRLLCSSLSLDKRKVSNWLD